VAGSPRDCEDTILVGQVVGNIGDDDVLPEEHRALDEERGLVVEAELPPPRRDEFRSTIVTM